MASRKRRSDRQQKAWGILFRSQNSLDGYREYLLGVPDHPCHRNLFETRRAARAFVDENYDYIRTRPDLRKEPHGWRVPIVVRVTMTFEYAA